MQEEAKVSLTNTYTEGETENRDKYRNYFILLFLLLFSKRSMSFLTSIYLCRI